MEKYQTPSVYMVIPMSTVLIVGIERNGDSMDYSKIQEPCFVCECEDSLGEERGTQSHPINCGWRVKREKAGYEAGLNEILKLSREQDELSKEEFMLKVRNISLSTLFARYHIEKKE